MIGNSLQNAHRPQGAVEVTEEQVRRARLMIERSMPTQATNMDAILLAGVAHALAVQEQQRQPLHH